MNVILNQSNKDGFKLFAIELLKASLNTETIIEKRIKKRLYSF
jgi:hypothetical protein